MCVVQVVMSLVGTMYKYAFAYQLFDVDQTALAPALAPAKCSQGLNF